MFVERSIRLNLTMKLRLTFRQNFKGIHSLICCEVCRSVSISVELKRMDKHVACLTDRQMDGQEIKMEAAPLKFSHVSIRGPFFI